MKTFNNIGKVLGLVIALSMILLPVIETSAKTGLVNGCRYEYRVKDLEEESGWALKIMSQRENKVRLSNMLSTGESGGQSVYILERVEHTKEGNRDESGKGAPGPDSGGKADLLQHG